MSAHGSGTARRILAVVIQFWLATVLLCAGGFNVNVKAQSPSLFDLVRQTSQGKPVSGWSFASADGWQMGEVVREAATTPGAAYGLAGGQSDFVPGWAAYSGYAFWGTLYRYAPVWGFFVYTPVWNSRFTTYRTSGVLN